MCRHVRQMYFDPSKDKPLCLASTSSSKRWPRWCKAGKVRAVGLSNETPYGVHEFVRLAEQHGLPRVATHAEPLLPDQPHLGERPGRILPPPGRGPAGLFAAGASACLTGKYDATAASTPPPARGPARPHGEVRSMKSPALGPPRSAGGRCQPVQRAGPRARTDADAAGAGLLLHASGKVASTIIGVTSAGPARRRPRRLGHDAASGVAQGDRCDPLGASRPGALEPVETAHAHQRAAPGGLRRQPYFPSGAVMAFTKRPSTCRPPWVIRVVKFSGWMSI
jgi:hypothetical protein